MVLGTATEMMLGLERGRYKIISYMTNTLRLPPTPRRHFPPMGMELKGEIPVMCRTRKRNHQISFTVLSTLRHPMTLALHMASPTMETRKTAVRTGFDVPAACQGLHAQVKLMALATLLRFDRNVSLIQGDLCPVMSRQV